MLTRLRRVLPACTVAAMLVAGACSHAEPPSFVPPDPAGPFGTVSPIRLTFNPGTDGAANFSQDARSIVYTFAAPGRHDRDRCLGVIPAGGGTRIYEKCEIRVAYDDSTDSFTSGALAADGRLLYLQATSRTIAQLPGTVQLFLADTASSGRRLLLTLPVQIAGNGVTWLSDIRWTGPAEFSALAQQITVVPICPGCGPRDTVFIPLFVVRGTVTASGATLQSIVGSEGAVSYAFTADHSQISITSGGPEMLVLPAAGGTPTVVATLPGATDRILGHDCTGAVCVAVTGNMLVSVPFAGGAFTTRAIDTDNSFASPRLLPGTTDVLLQVRSATGRDLYLFKGLL